MIATLGAVYAEIPNANAIPRPVWNLILPLDFQTMYELGDKKTTKIQYKAVFTGIGMEHFSIDINGLHGAVPLDLREPIDLPPRDIVTNIGTSEHVMDGQEMCFKNIHNLSSRRMVHWVPYARSMPFHGLYGYDLAFFEKLAAANHYVVEKLYMLPYGPRGIMKIACAALRKTNDNEFKWIGSDLIHAKRPNRKGQWRFQPLPRALPAQQPRSAPAAPNGTTQPGSP
jgi:hypothetical protein